MPVIETGVNRSSEEFEKNREAHEALADQLREIDNYVMQGGSARARDKHLRRGPIGDVVLVVLLDGCVELAGHRGRGGDHGHKGEGKYRFHREPFRCDSGRAHCH